MTKIALLGLAVAGMVAAAAGETLVFSSERVTCPSNTLAACARAMRFADGFVCGLVRTKGGETVCGADGVALDALLAEAKRGGKRLFLSFDMRHGHRLAEIVGAVGEAGLGKDDVWFRIDGYGDIGANVAALGGHPAFMSVGTYTGRKAVDRADAFAQKGVAGIISPFYADAFSAEERRELSAKGVKLAVTPNVRLGALYAAAVRQEADAILTDDAAVFAAELANETCEIPASPYVLYVGAGSPTLDLLATNCAALEAEAPFDGLLFHMGATMVMHAKPIDRAALDANVAKYRAIPFRKFRHNFLMTMIDQCDPKWFDDAAWAQFTENFRVAAAAARDAGIAGLCFDPECYGGPVRRAWMSAVQAKDGHSSNDCVRIARARGRQVAEAVFGEYPTMRFFSFYWWSFNADMMGAFCNGMVEAMPVSGRMIDGNEWNGYVAKGPYTYKWHAWENMRGFGWLDRALEGKHRLVGETAPTFYLDAYADPNSGCILREGKPRDKYFARNLLGAKRFSCASYIWMYAEGGTFWKSTVTPKRPLWETKIPGITKVLFGKLSGYGGVE